MQELIPINKSAGGKDIVSGRLLHEFLESKQDFTDWIKARIVKYDFLEGSDFSIILGRSDANRQTTEYVLTLDMAKELAMVEGNDKGKQARRYFIACEKKLRAIAEAPRPALPTTYKEALAALLSEVEQKEKLEQELALAAPAVAFKQIVSDSKDLLSIGELAKTLNIPKVGRTNFFRWLRRDGYLMRDNQPYQKHIEKGLFVVRQRVLEQRSENNNLQSQTMVTGKGVIELTKRYKPEASS